jgi:hypothetical protein
MSKAGNVITLRMTPVLKMLVEREAAADGVSAEAFVTACLEGELRARSEYRRQPSVTPVPASNVSTSDWTPTALDNAIERAMSA